jgi:hypothetical protein
MTLHRAFLLAAASLLVAAPALAAPPEAAPQHGGRLLPHPSAVLEVVHDPVAGTLTLHVSKPSGGSLELARAPRYLPPSAAGTQAAAFTAVPETQGAWRVSNAALKARQLAGTLEVLLDDAPQTLALATQPDRQEGLLLFGGDALRLRFRSHAHDGSLELTTVSATDALTLGDEVPQVLVNESGREVAVPLTRRSDAQDSVAWSVKDVAAVKTGGTVRVRAKVGGATHEAAIHLTHDETVGVHGGPILVFGDGVARVEVVHDPAGGLVAFHALPTPPDPKAGKPESLELKLTTQDGAKELKAGPVSDCVCVWLLRAPELREPSLQGAVRVKVGDQVLEAALPSSARSGQAPPVAKPTGDTEAKADPKR